MFQGHIVTYLWILYVKHYNFLNLLSQFQTKYLLYFNPIRSSFNWNNILTILFSRWFELNYLRLMLNYFQKNSLRSIFQVTTYYSLASTDPKGLAKRYSSNTWNKTTTKWVILFGNEANTSCWSNGATITYLVRLSKSKPKSYENIWSNVGRHWSNQSRGVWGLTKSLPIQTKKKNSSF